MAYKISDIEGIGPVISEKFAAVGIKTVEGLLEKGASKKGRDELAAATGLDASKILVFVNNADLFRVKGVSSQYAELLKASGVDTVKELRNRKPENLHAKMKEVNAEKNLVRQVASLSQVEGFVNHAKELEPMVTH
jgi:predicted flap endonuclease-1-like 5' DNA nuclease